MKKRLLFLCTGNSARSQLAEALFRHLCNDSFIVASAGTAPSEIDPRVFEVLKANAVGSQGLKSQSVEQLQYEHFDYVITLCDKANHECALFSDSQALIHWDFSDPKYLPGIQPFIDTFNGLKARISLFLMLNGQEAADPFGPVELFKIMSDPLRLKVLMLIEDEQSLSVGDLVNVLEVSQPKVSRHLALLRDGGILQVKKQGLWVFYSLSEHLPAWIRHTLATVRNGNPGIINREKIKLHQIADRKQPQ
ncbi:metalloregulator ArsR/SmtB family transcription factor [Psychromonas ossibalaenae]|uniref:metalloregulator ArsR/SmtB family transcription factor n=1 Tax=Psychromonas ossibalaenae TaxID=444922 RepID=UPI00035EB366|nr:metalloregulator ArsR/SmtB family transcription factor [Psychromonas ossibalaenae]